jgi:cytochrome c553
MNLNNKYWRFEVRTGIFLVAIAIVIVNVSGALAGDAKAATSKAESLCAGCHGPDGISTNPLFPNLAGQKDQYLIKVMQEYRDSIRPDPNMKAIMQGLSNKEIEDLAAYYAALLTGD